jgi:hypothetical protein
VVGGRWLVDWKEKFTPDRFLKPVRCEMESEINSD